MFGLGGGGGGTTKVENRPWSDKQRSLQGLAWDQAKKNYAATPKEAFQGRYVAPMSDMSRDYIGMMRDAAGRDTGGGAVRNLAMDTIAGKYLDVSQNPAMRGAIDASTRPLYENLGQTILPGLRSQAIAGGAYGGSKNAISEALAAGQTQQAAGDISSQIAYKAGERERTLQMAAPQMLSTAAALENIPIEYMRAAGASEESYAQREIQDRMARWQGEIDAPWIGFDRLQGPAFVGSGMESSSSGGGGAAGGPAMGAATGAMGGAATGAAVSGALAAAGMANPYLWPLVIGGGLLGGASGYMGG